MKVNGDQQRSKKKRKWEGEPQHSLKVEQPIGETPLANGMSQGAKSGVLKADLGGKQQGKRKKGTVAGGSTGSPVQEAAIKEEDKSEVLLNGIAKMSKEESSGTGTLSKKQKKKAKRKALNGVAPS